MAKKKTTEKALNIDNILFNCRDLEFPQNVILK